MNFNLLLNKDGDTPPAPKKQSPQKTSRFSINSMINNDADSRPTSASSSAPNSLPPSAPPSAPSLSPSVSHPAPRASINSLLSSPVSKPRRYSSPPIWAQDWKPQTQVNVMAKELSQKSYNENLDVSITRIVPYEDLTRKISQWLYSHLSSLKEEGLLEFMELEMKFGQIYAKESETRIALPVSSETIVTDHTNFYFRPGMDEPMFSHIMGFLRKNNAKLGEDMFKSSKFDLNDLFYKGVRIAERPHDLRITKDNETGRVLAQIEKRRVGDILIYNPSDALDYRLSLSLEIPIPDVPKSIEKDPPTFRRRKIRTSYAALTCKSMIDLTKVYTFHESSKPHAQNCEIEIELDTKWLIHSFNSTFNPTSDQTYEDTLRVLLNNSRVLNRCLTEVV